jgi:hypothetical protein
MKAKTYKSTNGFTAPQSLDKFGIEVSNGKEKKHLGLEEFNFCSILKSYSFNGKHIAFIPCFSINRGAAFIDELDLFFHDGQGVTLHYATLHGVTQIKALEIPAIRKDLISVGLPEFVHNSIEFQNNYGPLFNPAIKIWDKCFNTNIIIAKGTDDRFVVNTFYEKVVLHNPKRRVNWANLKYARALHP